MLALSTLLLSVAAVALVSTPGRWLARPLGASAAMSCVWGSILDWGFAEGLLVALVLAMGSASVLVLLLPPRPHVAWPLGLFTSALGLGLFILQALR